MGKATQNILYLTLALVIVAGALLWKIWPLMVLAVPAIAAIFIKRRTR
ncbi:MAG: hypothetical protein ACC641_05840 [Acidiferrobacterales bacterium]